jgi:predicted Zn-ribbon and HTH transcriptional regulator
MTKSRWQQYKEKNGVTILDALNPMTKNAPKDVYDARMEICLSCPELIKLTSQCKKCGCFMNLKTKIEAAKCPIGKW